MRYALGDAQPTTLTENYWIAPSADLIGDVVLGDHVSVWWNATLRGDNEPITIGDNSNIQDGCVLHTDPGFPLDIAGNVSVGHMCMLHGCTIAEGSLIGIGSIVLNGARIGRNCLIGANTLIAEGKEVPDNSLVLGSPGKVVREVSPEQRDLLGRIVASYVARSRRYREQLRPLG